MYSIKFLPSAESAIEDIHTYLESFSSPSDIEKVEGRIEATVDGLSDMPTRHRRYHPPLAHHPDIRCAPAGKYVVYFDLDEDARRITVLDVQHHRRDPDFSRRRLG